MKVFNVEYRHPNSTCYHWETNVAAETRGQARNYVENLHPGCNTAQVRYVCDNGGDKSHERTRARSEEHTAYVDE